MDNNTYSALDNWRQLIESQKTRNDGTIDNDGWVTLPVMPGIMFKGLRVSDDNDEDLDADDKIQFTYDEWKPIDQSIIPSNHGDI